VDFSLLFFLVQKGTAVKKQAISQLHVLLRVVPTVKLQIKDKTLGRFHLFNTWCLE